MDFNAILQHAQKLANETRTDDLPNIERSIPQVLNDAQDLHSRLMATGAQDIQAQFLMSTKGLDLPKLSQKLETLSTKKTLKPVLAIADTDIQSFLKNEKENAILSVIEDVHKNSYEKAQLQKWEKIKSDWCQEKVKLLNALVGPSRNWIDIQKIPEQTILNETTSGGRSCLNKIEMAYAKEVFDYNKRITERSVRPNLLQKFVEVAATFNDPKVSEIWEIMKYMVNVTPLPRSVDPIKSRVQMTEFIDQAKKYLENRYRLYMSTVIAGNLKEAQRGGIPSTYNLVASFVGLTLVKDLNQGAYYGFQDKSIDGKPLWPMVYYCLRCGDYASALQCIQMAGPDHEEIAQALQAKVNSNEKINPKLEGQLKLQYKCQIKNSTDPFKKVVYCVIAGCDPSDQHPEVAKTTDDFLWIQLSLLRTGTDDLTYSSLQTKILEEYGEKHFNASDKQHLYFQVLALTGQFEAAIEFLSRTEKYRTHAVHIALALNEMFLISIPRNVQEPLLSVDIEDPPPMRRLNIARLVMLYVKKFEITDPAEAIQYFFFLRGLKDPEGRNLFLVSVADLAIESREYDLIFGKIQPNGTRTMGLFDQFESFEFDLRSAATLVAEELVKKGIFEDAIKLFDIAEDYRQALRYLSVLLSQIVHQPSSPGSLRERIYFLATEFVERLKGRDIDCDSQTLSTFNILYQLLTFFDYYHQKKYQLALEVLNNTKLVPSSIDEIESCVNHFKRLSPEVCKVYPDILFATMDILYSQYIATKNKDSSIMDGGKERQLAYFRERAKVITNMAATVPYRMPGDTNSKLVQTEILMY